MKGLGNIDILQRHLLSRPFEFNLKKQIFLGYSPGPIDKNVLLSSRKRKTGRAQINKANNDESVVIYKCRPNVSFMHPTPMELLDIKTGNFFLMRNMRKVTINAWLYSPKIDCNTNAIGSIVFSKGYFYYFISTDC